MQGHGDARAELWKVRQVYILSELRLPLFHLHETHAPAFPALDLRKPTGIV
jgi:hypothetical protein